MDLLIEFIFNSYPVEWLHVQSAWAPQEDEGSSR